MDFFIKQNYWWGWTTFFLLLSTNNQNCILVLHNFLSDRLSNIVVLVCCWKLVFFLTRKFTAHIPIQFVINHWGGYGTRPECWSLVFLTMRTKIDNGLVTMCCSWCHQDPVGNGTSRRFFLLKNNFLLKSVGMIAGGYIGKETYKDFQRAFWKHWINFEQLKKHFYWVKLLSLFYETLIGCICIKKITFYRPSFFSPLTSVHVF